jgi:small nuclear ribonucleoprotein (snRNP)-like protein/mono/diheme cytochrome c family protein
MWDVRVPAIILAAGLVMGTPVHAQTPSEINLPAGDVVRGKAVFEGKGNCQSCHRVNGVGSLFGPDLSTIGAPPGRGGGGGGGGAAAGAPARGAAVPAAATTPPTAGAAAAPNVPPVPEAPRGGGGGGGGNRGAQGGAAAAAPTPQQLAQSILDPNAVVSVQNRYVTLKMKDGKTINGKLLSIDTFNVQVFDSSEKLANISRDNVRFLTMASPMPS